MPDKIHSLKDLKTALQRSALSEGAKLCQVGRHAEAVSVFDTINNLSACDTMSKSFIRIAYYSHGKTSQSKGDFKEGLRCFSKARETCPDDVLLTERIKLLASYQEYGNDQNIAEFREHFGLGFTSGKYGAYEYPFLEIAKEKGILEQLKPALRLGSVDSIQSIGRYRIQAQGRHLLSYKIREYKGKHPYGSTNPSLALPFACLLADFIRSNTKWIDVIDVIVPSPSNPENYVARGFVPSLLIGRKLSACLAVPYRELFSVNPMPCRFRDMSYSKAKELIRYKEKGHARIVKGRHILVLDDVVTTGRTLTLLGDLLKTDGATAVYCITLARTGGQSEGS